MRTTKLVLIAAVTAAACQDGGGVVSIDESNGAVVAVAYMDRDADGERSTADIAAPGVRAALVRSQGGDTVAAGTTGPNGSVLLTQVPVGRYVLHATRGLLGDTVDVLSIDTVNVMVALGDTVLREIRVGYPPVSLTAARALPPGQRTVVSGVALNAWSTFGDSTVHVRDASGSLRLVRMTPSGVQRGDSVRVIATTAEHDGNFVLGDGVIEVLASVAVPSPDSVSTADAAAALSNRDGQARIAGIVSDTATLDGGFLVGVNDGSGRLEVLLDGDIGFDADAYVPGAQFTAAGVLVPGAAAGEWRLKPRGAAEALISFPSVTTAQARALPPNRRVYVRGIALNAWAAFGDSTLHLQDAAGAVRVLRVAPAGIQAGDSVLVLATTATQGGHFVLTNGLADELSTASLPVADIVSTAAAAAGSGHADDQVRIAGATIVDTATVAGDRIIGVDDGSGRLEVVLDAAISFGTQTFAPGATFQGTGVLVPAGASAWRLKPRSGPDAVVSVPAVSITAARALAQGLRTAVNGIALNAWAAFGDSTLHVQDASGALRAIRVTPVGVSAGDSIYLVGTTGMRDGQFVLTDAIAQIITEDAGAGPADSVSTTTAAAGTGHEDGQVRIGGALVLDTATVGTDFVLGVDDGSGRLEVVLDGSQSWGAGPWVPDAVFAGTGVLVPDGVGAWRLKPRALGETAIAIPVVAIAEARTLPVGRQIYIQGVALNAWVAFGDSTLHVQDATGSVRVTRVASGAGVQAGDNVRVLATTGTQGGHFVLVDGAPQDLGSGTLPTPDSVSTAAAAAATGHVDGQVRVAGAVIVDTVTVGGDRILGVNDGSGRLEIVLDGSINFGAQVFAPGATFGGGGVLVPAGPTTWRVRPRSAAEAVMTVPAVTIADARAVAQGLRTAVVGVALNAWSAFGDSTLHVRDATGAVRAVRVAPVGVSGGDSVYVAGTVGDRDGQFVLTDAIAQILAEDVGAPAADSVSTQAASAATDHVDDQVRIAGALVLDTARVGTDFVLGVDDGSGRLEVVLDGNQTWGSGPWVPDAVFAGTGVLVSDGQGGWQLKPRGVAETAVAIPVVTIADARALPQGRQVYVQGVALNAWAAFGDSTLHVQDATGAVRITRVAAGGGIQAGDNVRVLAATATQDGHFVLTNGIPQDLGSGALPVADSVSTNDAALATGNTDGQVRIAGALITDTTTVGGERVIGVDDGSGRVEVALDTSINFGAVVFSPGATFRGGGVLVPSGPTTWRVKPRGAAEAGVSVPAVTIAAARAVAPGLRTAITGIALNSWVAFGDSTLHVQDATGAARAVRVAPVAVASGDSIYLVGTAGTQDGQFVLTNATAQVIAGVGRPPEDSVSTAAAAAGSGHPDDQVRIAGAIISDTTRVGGDFIMGVDDGSGRLEVVLDASIAWNAGAYAPQGVFTGSGVLVPTATPGLWRLKPRAPAEASAAFPTVTTAQARSLPAGSIVAIEGIALTARTTFGDSTVHVEDATGSLRTVQVVGGVSAGDSVRVVGTAGTVNGQRVLTSATATILQGGIGLATPDSLSTLAASGADAASRDAGQILIGGKILGIQPQPNGDQLLLVNDGSGVLEVVLDDDVSFGGVSFATGAILRAGGVLVPTGSGSWQLKPRGTPDVSITYTVATVDEARALPPGEVIYVYGIALNSRITFGDGSVHLEDATGAIRVQPTPGVSILAGDSVRFLGTTSVRNGQPVINASQAVVLLTGAGTDQPDSISTLAASTAEGGASDADHAVIGGTITAIGGGANPLLTVDDGSGPVSVLLDADAGFSSGLFVVGDVVRAEGLLVASTTAGVWTLMPRALDEIAKTGP